MNQFKWHQEIKFLTLSTVLLSLWLCSSFILSLWTALSNSAVNSWMFLSSRWMRSSAETLFYKETTLICITNTWQTCSAAVRASILCCNSASTEGSDSAFFKLCASCFSANSNLSCKECTFSSFNRTAASLLASWNAIWVNEKLYLGFFNYLVLQFVIEVPDTGGLSLSSQETWLERRNSRLLVGALCVKLNKYPNILIHHSTSTSQIWFFSRAMDSEAACFSRVLSLNWLSSSAFLEISGDVVPLLCLSVNYRFATSDDCFREFDSSVFILSRASCISISRFALSLLIEPFVQAFDA